MWDDIIAGTIKLIKNYGGPYAAMFIIAAILFPVVTIVAGTGYAWGWGIIHVILFILATTGTCFLFLKIGRRGIPLPSVHASVKKVLLPIMCAIILVLMLGIFNMTKPIAVIIGLLLSQIGLFYLIMVGSGLALTYGLAVAAATQEEVKDAEKREGRVWRHLIAIAAWECFAAWYIISLGQYLSIYTTAFLICAAGVIFYGGIAWGLGGKFGEKTIYYTAITGCLGTTIHAIYRLLLEEKLIDAKWSGQDFLKKAVDISGHTMEWFIAITVVLAIGFVVSKISKKKAIQENVRLVTFLTAGIFSLVWLIWFNGYNNISIWFTKLGQGALPTPEVWHGVIRLLVIILIIPALAIRFQRGGFRGFTIRLLWIAPCVLVPWFLFETFLWEWYPNLVGRLGIVIYGWLSATP